MEISRKNVILKNAMFLYIRMAVLMSVSLYTSRIVLEQLGVEDFGIYNVVGSCVVFFSFFNLAMSNSNVRFFSFELGKGDANNLSDVFSASININFAFCVILVLFAETIGIFVLNNYIKIPTDKLDVAHVVYQLSVLTMAVSIMQNPYNALIISHEKMDFYAYSSIFSAILKLGVAFALALCGTEKLFFYAFLILGASICMFIVYILYCNIYFRGVKYSFGLYKKYIVEMLFFVGWNVFGGAAHVINNQGVMIVVNFFRGVLINAAFAISNQVSLALYQLVSNFQIAFKPRLVKLYSEGNSNKFLDLIFLSTKISYVLMLMTIFPFLLNTEFILKLWLGIIPEYATDFIRVSMFLILFDAICEPLRLSIQATGRIKEHQIMFSIVTLLNIPLSIMALYCGFSPVSVLWIRLLLSMLIWGWRIFYLGKYVNLPKKKYVIDIMLKSGLILAITLALTSIRTNGFSILEDVLLLITIELTIVFLSYVVLLNKAERDYAKNAVANFLYKIRQFLPTK